MEKIQSVSIDEQVNYIIASLAASDIKHSQWHSRNHERLMAIHRLLINQFSASDEIKLKKINRILNEAWVDFYLTIKDKKRSEIKKIMQQAKKMKTIIRPFLPDAQQ